MASSLGNNLFLLSISPSKNRTPAFYTLMSVCMSMIAVVLSTCVQSLFTGSLLLACAHYGGYTIGTDINKVLLHGRGEYYM